MKRLTKEELKRRIGENLRRARLEREPKVTLDAVANLFDPPLSKAAVAQWEGGDTLPDVDRLVTIAREYGVSLDSLCFGEETNAKKPQLTEQALKLAKIFTTLGAKQRQAVFSLVMAIR